MSPMIVSIWATRTRSSCSRDPQYSRSHLQRTGGPRRRGTNIWRPRTTRGRATSCCFLGTRTAIARGRCGAARDWAGSCATIIARRRDGPTARPIIWPHALSTARPSRERVARRRLQRINSGKLYLGFHSFARFCASASSAGVSLATISRRLITASAGPSVEARSNHM